MDILTQLITVAVVLVVVLLAQWKTVRTLNSLHNLQMFYGKQIEEIRRLVSTAAPTPGAALPARESQAEVARGMYEILTESGEPAKPKAKPKA